LILTHPSQQFYFISLNINFAKTDWQVGFLNFVVDCRQSSNYRSLDFMLDPMLPFWVTFTEPGLSENPRLWAMCLARFILFMESFHTIAIVRSHSFPEPSKGLPDKHRVNRLFVFHKISHSLRSIAQPIVARLCTGLETCAKDHCVTRLGDNTYQIDPTIRTRHVPESWSPTFGISLSHSRIELVAPSWIPHSPKSCIFGPNRMSRAKEMLVLSHNLCFNRGFQTETARIQQHFYHTRRDVSS
jgi:hypothetical protein